MISGNFSTRIREGPDQGNDEAVRTIRRSGFVGINSKVSSNLQIEGITVELLLLKQNLLVSGYSSEGFKDLYSITTFTFSKWLWVPKPDAKRYIAADYHSII